MITAQEITQVPLAQAVGFIENTDNGFSKVNYDGAVGYILSQYLSTEKPAPAPVVTQQPVPVQNSSPIGNTYSTLSLGGISLSDSIEKVRSVLGREDRITRDSANTKQEYRDAVITYKEGRIFAVVSYSPAVRTERGIHEGSSLNEVISAYGRRCSIQNFDDSTLYEYLLRKTFRKAVVST